MKHSIFSTSKLHNFSSDYRLSPVILFKILTERFCSEYSRELNLIPLTILEVFYKVPVIKFENVAKILNDNLLKHLLSKKKKIEWSVDISELLTKLGY